MKKSVAVVIVLLLVLPMVLASRNFARMPGSRSYVITGAQILELPPPPPPPGGDQTPSLTPAPTPTPTPAPVENPIPTRQVQDILAQAQQNVTEINGRLDAIEQKLTALDLLRQFEDRLNAVEKQGAAGSNVVERVDALQSQVDAMKGDVVNLKQNANRPLVEQPTFLDSIATVQSSIKKGAIVSISLSILALIIVIGFIANAIVQTKKSLEENKRLLREYLHNYKSAGYSVETLREHLRASGWSGDLIDEVSGELEKEAAT